MHADLFIHHLPQENKELFYSADYFGYFTYRFIMLGFYPLDEVKEIINNGSGNNIDMQKFE